MTDVSIQKYRIGPVHRSRSSAGLEKALSVILLVWLLAGTFAQDLIFRSLAATLPAFAIIAIATAILFLRNGLAIRRDGPYMALLIYLAAGAFCLFLSVLGYPSIADLPRANQFIIRQGYFLVLLPMTILTGFIFWRQLYGAIYEFFARYFVPLSLTVMAADLATAYLFGDPLFREINGYSKYVDKLTLYFFFTLLFMARITHPARYSSFAPLLLLSGYFLATRLLTYGSLFAASTGYLLTGFMLIALVTRNRPNLLVKTSLMCLGALVALMAVGTAFPDLFAWDPNAFWRFKNWHTNFETLHQTAYVGIGFGTPYFPITSQDLEHSITILKRGSEPWTGNTETYDLIFMRAQHNSFVNMFFRTGVVGGISFLVFNLLLLRDVLRRVRSADAQWTPHLQTAFVLLVAGIVQTMLHVGIETPRFLIVYGLSVARVLLGTRNLALDRTRNP